MVLTNWLDTFRRTFRKSARRKQARFTAHSLAQTETLEERILLAADGFVAMPFATLPGTDAEIVEITSLLDRVHTDVEEVGFFVADDGAAGLNGLSRQESGYRDAVLSSEQRQTLFRRDSENTDLPPLTFEAHRSIGVYFLYDDAAEGEFHEFLRARDFGDWQFEIGWEEDRPLWPGGDRYWRSPL